MDPIVSPPTTSSSASTPGASQTGPASSIVTAVPVSHSGFSKFMTVLAALEPLILAGTSPFIKNANTQQLVLTEAPLAQTLFAALAQL